MQAQGNAVRERREALGVSIQDLARAAGISRDTLSDMESGRKDFRRSTLAKADRALRSLEVETGGAHLQADADRIAARRVALGISQEVLAREAGVNRDTVGAVENGLGFRKSSLAKLEAALGRLEDERGFAGQDHPATTDHHRVTIRLISGKGFHLELDGPVGALAALEASAARLVRHVHEADAASEKAQCNGIVSELESGPTP